MASSSAASIKQAIKTLMMRELRAVQRELDAYPDEAAVWTQVPGMPNTRHVNAAVR